MEVPGMNDRDPDLEPLFTRPCIGGAGRGESLDTGQSNAHGVGATSDALSGGLGRSPCEDQERQTRKGRPA
jgi:hypothetical protein